VAVTATVTVTVAATVTVAEASPDVSASERQDVRIDAESIGSPISKISATA
jgi:hypothetical protein